MNSQGGAGYDEDDEEPVTRGLRNLEEGKDGGQKTPDGDEDDEKVDGSTSNDGTNDDSDDNDGFYKPTKEEHHKGNVEAANRALGDLSGSTGQGMYTPGENTGKVKVFKSIRGSLRDRKKVLGVGGAAAGVITIVAAGFFLLIPLKIEHMVTNLQDRYFASSNEAVEEATQNMFKQYIVTKVLPAYKDCGSTISRSCTPKNFGANPVGNLYRAWSNARLENELADKHGIEFKYDKSKSTWYLKAPGAGADGIDIGSDGSGLEREYSSSREARKAIKAAIDDALQDETKWKQVMYRYKVGRLLEGKYGIVRCIMYCGKRDALRDNTKAKQNSARLYTVQRVIIPLLGTKGIAIECMVNPKCQPEQTSPATFSDAEGSPSQAENPDTDTKQRHTLVDLSKNYPNADVEKLQKDYDTMSEKGISKALFEALFEKMGFGKLSSAAASAIPFVGAVKTLSDVITFANNAGPALAKVGYLANSSAGVSQYMMYRTYADETHTGHADIVESGSMTNSLGPGNKAPPTDQQKGGTASAEATPLYQSMFGGSSSSKTASLLNNILPSASAASDSNSNEYVCDDGNSVPKGKLVCSEEVYGSGGVEQASQTHDFLNSPAILPVTVLAGYTSGVFATFSDFIGGFIKLVPGVSQAGEAVAGLTGQIIQPFVEAAIKFLLPNGFGTFMSGGRTFDMLAGGANVAGNDYAQLGLGCSKSSYEEYAKLVMEREGEAQQNFARQSLFARTFDTDSQYSLVSKAAMEVPFGTQAAAQSGMASLLNPLGGIQKGFGSILSGKASAFGLPPYNVFGVTPYTCKNIPKDPETYWANHCSDDSSKGYQNEVEFQNAPGGQGWAGAAAAGPPDEQTGMPVNTTDNPCMLIKAVTGTAGGWDDTSLLTDYDRGDQSGEDSGDVDSSGPTVVSGDAQEWAKALVDSGRLSSESSDYMGQVEAIANGNFECNINPDILKMLYGVVVLDKHSVQISSLNRYCTNVLTASGTGSYHYTDGGGHAVDVTLFDGKDVNGKHEPGTLGYLNSAVKYLPKGTGFGQVPNCGSGFSVPAGDTSFEDSCDHQHIQVPVKRLR